MPGLIHFFCLFLPTGKHFFGMARFYPSFQELGKLAIQPSKAEWTLLCFFKANLDFRYEVFFHPEIGADRPDIIVMRKFRGVMIFSVCDDTDLFTPERKSPTARVREFCANFNDLYLPSLGRKQHKTGERHAPIHGCVYFHNASRECLGDFVASADDIEILGNDELDERSLDSMLQRHLLAGATENNAFDADMYSRVRVLIRPEVHETGNEALPKRGKAYLFAATALSEYRRKVSEGIAVPKIMILCPSITMRSRVADYLTDSSERFNGNTFTITEYRHFIHSQLNNLSITADRSEGMPLEEFIRTYYENSLLFAGRDTTRFDAIITDKASEYGKQWLQVLAENFLNTPNGTMTEICGSISVSAETSSAAEEASSYDSPCNRKSVEVPANLLLPELYRRIRTAQTEAGNIAVLCSNIAFLREFEAFYRHASRRRTTACLESYEMMFFITLSHDPWRHLFVNSIFRVPFTREYTDDYVPRVCMARVLTILELMNHFPVQFDGLLAKISDELKLPRVRIREILDEHPQEYAALRSEAFGTANIRQYKKIRNGKRYNFNVSSRNIKICHPDDLKGQSVKSVFFIGAPGIEETDMDKYADTALSEFTYVKPI